MSDIETPIGSLLSFSRLETLQSLVRVDDRRRLEVRCAACRDTGWMRDGDAVRSCECRDQAVRLIDARRHQAAVAWVHAADSVDRPDELSVRDAYSAEGLEWSRSWGKAMLASWAGTAVDWRRAPSGARVWGRPGSGKSTLLCHLLQWLAIPTPAHPKSLGFSVCYAKLDALISGLAAADFDGTYAEKLASLRAVDVLVLDDWGWGTIQKTRGRYLLAAIDARWEVRRPILMTSNYNPAVDEEMGLRYHPDDAADIERALDRLVAIASSVVNYDSPVSRRKS